MLTVQWGNFVQASARQSIVKLLSGGMHRSGSLRLLQFLSRTIEVSSSRNGPRKLRRSRGPKFAILCYHRVGTGGVPYHSELHPRVFEAQIKFLRRTYRIVSLDQLCRELADADPQATNTSQAVAITFDDGYRDLYEHALPVLRKYDLPATVYLTASAIETGEVPWYDRIFALLMSFQSDKLEFEGIAPMRLSAEESRMHAAMVVVRTLRQKYSNRERMAACAALEAKMDAPAEALQNRMLNWEQIREMQQAGIAFEAHTMGHPVVSRLAASERERELVDSRQLLEERLQKPVTHFAYPFGSVSDIDPQTCSLLPHYGYRSAASTVWGVNTPRTHRYLLRRIGAEELTVPQLAFYLRWLFFSEEHPSAELLALEHAAECQATMPKDPVCRPTTCEAGGSHA